MNPRWHIGAKELRGAIAAYAKRFDLLEVRATVERQPQRQRQAEPQAQERGPGAADEHGLTPALPTLRRWRKSVPPHFAFSVVAGPNLSRVKASDAAERELEAARAAIDALQARCFVLRTPPDVTPTSLWRDRLAKLVERVPHDVTHFVWEPSGVWETVDAASQARAWGIVLAVDPAREPVPPGQVAYLRMRSLGETRSFGPITLERVVRAVGPQRRDVFAVIETDTALAEAKRLRQLSKGTRAAARLGGGTRLVRPRDGIVVRDDEQE